MTTINTTPAQRTAARKAAGAIGYRGTPNNSIPVIAIEGQLPPKKVGCRGGHFTRGGRRISHPGAYSRRGWSNMVYHCSTQRIYVGSGWLAANAA